MKFNKLWIFTILCSVLLLSACGKEKEIVEVDKPSQEDLDPWKQYATEYVEPEFKEKYELSLTGREVQFNLSNNLNEDFYLDGNVKLCDYYNYGYTNEAKFFCGQLTPVDGGYSDSWYLYFDRDSFDDVFQALLDGNVDMKIAARIPGNSYKQGQGNMALVRKLETY